MPIAWPRAWTRPTPVPLAWPTPARCEAIEHLRARLEVRAVRDRPRQPRRDGPDDAERHRLGERVRVARQERFERVGHGVDPGRGGRGRRQADGQRRVEDRRDREQRRVADVVLAPGVLVGDDRRSELRLGAGPGRRRHRDDRADPASGPAPSYSSSQTGRVVGGAEVDAPWPRPSTSRHRPATTTVPSSPKSRQAAAPRSTVDGSPGSARPRRTARSSRPAAARTLEDAVDDARPDGRPGRSRRRRARHRPLATTSGSRSMAPTPKQDAIAQDDLERPVGQAASLSDLQHRIGRGVAPDRQPAPAAERVEPALGRRAVGVLEDPDLVEVALVGVGDPVRDGAALAAERELVDRTAAAARAGRASSISGSPPSPGRPGRGRAGSGRA